MPEELSLEQKIESILFFKGEPVALRELARILQTEEESIVGALDALEASLSGRGLVLVRNSNEVALGTHPALAPLFETLRKEEFTKELSKSALETLSIILYKEGATRGDIDYIRGVNSSVILRNLLVRGLIEKKAHKDDSRKYIYMPTVQMLEHLGITRASDLPGYDAVAASLSQTAKEQEEEADDGTEQPAPQEDETPLV